MGDENYFFLFFLSGLELCRADSDGVTPEHSIGSHSIGSHSIGSEASDSTVIFLPGHDSSYKSDRLNDSQISSSSQRSQDYSVSRNPVIDRLTGHHPGLVNNALRNESYYRVSLTMKINFSSLILRKYSLLPLNPDKGHCRKILVQEKI